VIRERTRKDKQIRESKKKGQKKEKKEKKRAGESKRGNPAPDQILTMLRHPESRLSVRRVMGCAGKRRRGVDLS
jgi:hypothetical protein